MFKKKSSTFWCVKSRVSDAKISKFWKFLLEVILQILLFIAREVMFRSR